MKLRKSAIVLATFAMAGPAMAQSSLTIFGVVDTAVTHISASGLGSKTGLSSGSSSPSRLGFRGVEDLGGGLAASFWLEAPLNVDVGTSNGLSFTRRSTVSLSGPFGELRLGRDFSPTWWNVSLLDPFAARGVGTSQAANNLGYNSVWNNNSVGYVLPASLGGFYGQAQYAFGEKASTTANDKAGNFYGGRFGYMAGPLNVVGAYGKWKQVLGASDTTPVVIGSDLAVSNVAATWDFGVVKPIVFYGREKVTGTVSTGQVDSLLVGASAPLGLGELKATVARYDVKNSANDFNKFAVGYAYFLSKRTTLFATAARLSNKGNATAGLSTDGLTTLGATRAGGNASGFEFGVRHVF